MNQSTSLFKKCGVLSWYFFFALCIQNMMSASSLDSIIDPIDPSITKWASLVIVSDSNDQPEFDWHHYRNSHEDVDFWPASTIKIYTVVAALEYLNELEKPFDSTLIFERQTDAQWHLDTARTMREMISEIFRRSSNEDYTLLLRFVGIDRMNTQFLIPEKGFSHSALMRDYVVHRPVVYVNSEPQRIRIVDSNHDTKTIEHTWSGISYAEQRGATILSSKTGNCTSTAELADCLRRIMFHESIPQSERYQLTSKQVDFIRYGDDGLYGLENKEAGPYAWEGNLQKIFPEARYFHKAGMISNYTLDVAYIDDPRSNTRFILSLAAKTGKGDTVRKMAGALAQWVQSQ